MTRGYDRFLLHGEKEAQAEWSLFSATLNLLRLSDRFSSDRDTTVRGFDGVEPGYGGRVNLSNILSDAWDCSPVSGVAGFT